MDNYPQKDNFNHIEQTVEAVEENIESSGRKDLNINENGNGNGKANGNEMLNRNCKNCRFKVSKLKYNGNGSSEESDSNIVEISFKGGRSDFYLNDDHLIIKENDWAVVEADNGLDIGIAYSSGVYAAEKHKLSGFDAPARKIVRIANEEDVARLESNIEEERRAERVTRDLVVRYNLEMKIIEAEWQFDKQRLTIYFTAPHRIDFRELVKELARTFKTRIELRQISAREETKRKGDGVGCCGLTLCCLTFLNDFQHVTLDHARLQQLSNNVSKLSGYCGRLKCCLLFEYKNYESAFEKYPPINSTVHMKEGRGKIQKVDIFRDVVHLFIEPLGKYQSMTYEELEKYLKNGKVSFPKHRNGNGNGNGSNDKRQH